MNTKSCVVLMPFRPDLNERFEFFRECGKKAGLDVQRVDTYAFSGNIPNAIARSLVTADLVIGDLCDGNANVTYEIAIAQCMGLKVVLVTNDRNTVPFDLRQYRIELLSEFTPEAADSFTRTMQQALLATYVGGPLGGQAIFGQRIFVRRTLALAVDILVLFIFGLILSGVLDKWFPILNDPQSILSEWVTFITPALLLVITYYTATTRWLGASFGQRALDLKVVDYNGQQLGFMHSLGRSFASLASIMTYGVGYFWALHGPSYRTFHDILSRTMVIRRKGKPKHAPL